MTDPRVNRMADVLVDYSTRIKPGDRVLIEGQPAAEPLIRALFEKILAAGGHPQLLLSLSGLETMTGLDDVFLAKADESQLDFPPIFYQQAYDTFESRIRIHSLNNTRMLTAISQNRKTRRNRATAGVLRAQFERGGRGNFKWLTTLFPTQAYAQDAEMSLEEFENFVFQACHVDTGESDSIEYWSRVESEQQRLVEALNGHDRVELKGPNVDLSLSIRDRIFLNACGQSNMPDGEIFTGPVEKSLDGWVNFSYPTSLAGSSVEGVQLRFREGRVVEATAEKNEAYLREMIATDAGASYVGEFAFGLNMGIQRNIRNILFDEKIGGSFHLALGAGYPETGSVNESAIHWDLICDMKTDAEVHLDGDLIYKDGAFCI
ncbi:MAG: aminopeptidase [Anaerolineales bacterium]|nr:aminopeptidase [Anaerolineales bacterium]